MMEKQRMIWADSLKGILIILVVLGHAIQGVYSECAESSLLWRLIYSFHMPAFFAISGYFVRYGGGYKSLKKRILQLLIPYFAWAFIKLLISGNLTFASISGIVLEPVSFWFLWVLFWVYLIFQLSLYFHDVSKAHFNYVSLVFAFILMVVMAVLNTKMFAFHLIAYYFSFYTIGYYMGAFNFLKINTKWLLGMLAIVWLSLALFWSMHNLPTWVPSISFLPVAILQLSYRFITAFIAIVVLLNAAPILLSSQSSFNNSIAKMGFYSLGIYVTHYLIIWPIADFITGKLMIVSDAVNVLIVFLLALILSLALVWLLNKNKYTAAILLGKLSKQ